MDRLANFDISRRFSKPQLRLVAQLVFGAGCAALMIAIRSLVDIVAPTAGPFALVYPTVLLATLYGHWQAGVVACLGSFFWAWWYVLPGKGLLEFELPTDPSRVALNLITVLIVLIFAESFRRAVVRSAQARDREVERVKLLLAELEQRRPMKRLRTASGWAVLNLWDSEAEGDATRKGASLSGDRAIYVLE